MDSDPIQAFINRWAKSGGAERANYQLFLAEQLWHTMNMGGFSVQFRNRLLHFNGKLFADCSALHRIAELLETLASLGKARELEDGRYVAV